MPPIAIRMTGMPTSVPTEQIEAWVDRLKQVAAAAGAAMTSAHGVAGAISDTSHSGSQEWRTPA